MCISFCCSVCIHSRRSQDFFALSRPTHWSSVESWKFLPIILCLGLANLDKAHFDFICPSVLCLGLPTSDKAKIKKKLLLPLSPDKAHLGKNPSALSGVANPWQSQNKKRKRKILCPRLATPNKEQYNKKNIEKFYSHTPPLLSTPTLLFHSLINFKLS